MSTDQLWTSFPERTMFVQILAMLSKARYARYENKLLGDVAHTVDILAMYTVCDAGLLWKQGWTTSGHEWELMGHTGMNGLGTNVYL